MLLGVQTLQAQSQLTMTVTALERKLGAINEENQVRSMPKDRACLNRMGIVADMLGGL